MQYRLVDGGRWHRHADVGNWKRFSQETHLGGGLFLSVQTARKRYQCERCLHPIEPGSIYARFRQVRDNDGIPAGMTVQRHMNCLSQRMNIETKDTAS